jgi:hypothetical protein
MPVIWIYRDSNEHDQRDKMGIGLNAWNKRVAVRNQTKLYKEIPDVYSAICIDGCAWFRKVVPPNLPGDVSPFTAVQTIFLPSVRKLVTATTKTVYIGFDDSTRTPEVRALFYANRRYKTTSVSLDDAGPEHSRRGGGWALNIDDDRYYKAGDEPALMSEVDGLTAHSMGCSTWSKMWNNSAGKARLWVIITDVILDILRTGGAQRGVQYVIETTSSEKIYFPPLKEIGGVCARRLPDFTYGEGDLKCIVAALHYASKKDEEGRVLVVTIDWDVPFIALQ